ncbi:MAG: hypothetical protein IM613_12865 [Cytophagales bacterium]|nr:hypothetical protein [Cytophagales bacterium]
MLADFGFLDDVFGKVVDSPIANKLIQKNTKAIESIKRLAPKRGQIDPPPEGYKIPKRFDPNKPINFYIHGLGGFDKKVGGNQLVDELKKSPLAGTTLGSNIIPVNPKKLRNSNNPTLVAQDLDRDADRVTRQIIGYKKKNPNARINVTGHSMGGTLAEKVGQRLKERGLLDDGSVRIASVSGYRPRVSEEAKSRLRSPNFTPIRNEAEDLPRNAFMGDEVLIKGGKGHAAQATLNNPEGQKVLKRALNLRKEVWLLADFGYVEPNPNKFAKGLSKMYDKLTTGDKQLNLRGSLLAKKFSQSPRTELSILKANNRAVGIGRIEDLPTEPGKKKFYLDIVANPKAKSAAIPSIPSMIKERAGGITPDNITVQYIPATDQLARIYRRQAERNGIKFQDLRTPERLELPAKEKTWKK